MPKYTVEVKSVAGYTLHSEHESYREAVDQADMVHGRVMVDGREIDTDSVAYHPCCHCEGTGTIEDSDYGDCECSACGGTGEASDE